MASKVDKVEEIASYARQSGDQVRLVLHLPEATDIDGPEVQLRIRGPRGQEIATATVGQMDAGVRLEASVPAKLLKPDVYRIAMRPNREAPFRRVQARLLTSNTQPIALLTGPAPRTVITPPRPIARAGARPQAVRVVASVIDKALGRLPEERAARYRTSLRKVARRVLS